MSDFTTPHDIDALTAAFPASVADLMPRYEDIPEDFKRRYGPAQKWTEFQSTWFFFGLSDKTVFKPKKGIDKAKALRHLATIQGSFEPKHEHKQAAVAYLASLWFKDIKAVPAKAVLS